MLAKRLRPNRNQLFERRRPEPAAVSNERSQWKVDSHGFQSNAGARTSVGYGRLILQAAV
jgi:hypothetical protein